MSFATTGWQSIMSCVVLWGAIGGSPNLASSQMVKLFLKVLQILLRVPLLEFLLRWRGEPDKLLEFFFIYCLTNKFSYISHMLTRIFDLIKLKFFWGFCGNSKSGVWVNFLLEKRSEGDMNWNWSKDWNRWLYLDLGLKKKGNWFFGCWFLGGWWE